MLSTARQSRRSRSRSPRSSVATGEEGEEVACLRVSWQHFRIGEEPAALLDVILDLFAEISESDEIPYVGVTEQPAWRFHGMGSQSHFPRFRSMFPIAAGTGAQIAQLETDVLRACRVRRDRGDRRFRLANYPASTGGERVDRNATRRFLYICSTGSGYEASTCSCFDCKVFAERLADASQPTSYWFYPPASSASSAAPPSATTNVGEAGAGGTQQGGMQQGDHATSFATGATGTAGAGMQQVDSHVASWRAATGAGAGEAGGMHQGGLQQGQREAQEGQKGDHAASSLFTSVGAGGAGAAGAGSQESQEPLCCVPASLSLATTAESRFASYTLRLVAGTRAVRVKITSNVAPYYCVRPNPIEIQPGDIGLVDITCKVTLRSLRDVEAHKFRVTVSASGEADLVTTLGSEALDLQPLLPLALAYSLAAFGIPYQRTKGPSESSCILRLVCWSVRVSEARWHLLAPPWPL